MNPSDAPRASSLVWLRPSVDTLIGLTDNLPDANLLKADPGMVLHLLRYARPSANADAFQFEESLLTQPGFCTSAANLWEIDSQPATFEFSAHQFGLTTAHVATQIAERSELCSPDAAWSAGLLTPLAWYLTGSRSESLKSARLVRRATQQWKLPAWLSSAISFTELPINEVVKLGGHRGLLRVLRTAVSLTHHLFPQISLVNELIDAKMKAYTDGIVVESPEMPERRPYVQSADLLPRLLRSTAQLRTKNQASAMADLERQVDTLTNALGESRREFDRDVRDAKLASLAEFAAGAAHEINNPLAVIAGNVELLLDFDLDPEWQQRLNTITRQTKRINEILHGTHQFARPSAPTPTEFSARDLLEHTSRELSVEAEDQRVRLDFHAVKDAVINADFNHLQTSLLHVARNAIRAAGENGWVRVNVESHQEQVWLIVEDSGHGPSHDVIPHLFDPFFSGRSAGRGRGLGLSIAWRLMKANGGDVTYEPLPDHPSRFILRVPLAEPAQLPERISA